MKRKPTVAGSFYPNNPNALMKNLRSQLPQNTQKQAVIGVVCPHAGFLYSGTVAGAVYASIEIPKTIILIGPNHTGTGPPISVMSKGQWEMPQGPVEIDTTLANDILESSPDLEDDFIAHCREHSLETQIPFLQYFRQDFKIVPICIQKISLNQCQTISRAILSGMKKLKQKVLIVASSDMSHYESYETVSRKDKLAITRILDRDPKALFEIVDTNRISMCGLIPTTVMLMTANELGAKYSKLIHYTTSGEVTRDMDRVVGYAGIIIY